MTTLTVALPTSTLRYAIGDVDGVEFVEWAMNSPAPRNSFDIVVPPYMAGTSPLQYLQKIQVRLVQWQSIGFDGVGEILAPNTPFANAESVHEASTAELAVGLIIAAQRGIPGFVRDAANGTWGTPAPNSLADRRVLLIGYGGVSKAVEARLAGFEVTVERLARTAREDRNLAGESVPVHGIDELHECLSRAEVVVIALPLSSATEGLFGAEALAQLPDNALVVNVARGPIVNTEALLAELGTGRIRAALDVTDPEPLPSGHPLWGLPNALITPHVGGASAAMLPRIAALVRRQIAHLQQGEQPENLVLGSWEE